MAKARGNGEGSIARHGDGWRVRWTTPSGTRKSKVIRGDKREAQSFLTTVLADIERGTFRNERAGAVTFAEFAEQFMEVRQSELRPGTLRNYRALLNHLLLPAFASTPMNRITRRGVEVWWSRHTTHP